MTHYELLYLVSANFTEDELEPIKKTVVDLIKQADGEITFEENFGKKKLAYPINGDAQGYYIMIEFDLPGEKLSALDRNLRLANEVLRHMIVGKKLGVPSPLKMDDVFDPNANSAGYEKKPVRQATPITETFNKTQSVPPADSEKEKEKVKLEDLDDKLDEILEGNIKV